MAIIETKEGQVNPPTANGESADLVIQRLVVQSLAPATGQTFTPFPWHSQVEQTFFCTNLIEKLQLVSIFGIRTSPIIDLFLF